MTEEESTVYIDYMAKPGGDGTNVKIKTHTTCGLPAEGHRKGSCTKRKGHNNYCWFPNMWNDM